MTVWYAWKWLCEACHAVHYYPARQCCRCGHDSLQQAVNNPERAEAEQKKEAGKETRLPSAETEPELEPCDTPEEDPLDSILQQLKDDKI